MARNFLKTMGRICFLVIFLFAGCFSLYLPEGTAVAQNTLERISAAERSDGKGYVIRFHTSQVADSFQVIHPTPDFIQMKIYAEDLEPVHLDLPPPSDTFHGFEIHKTTFGLGVDIFLSEKNYFKTITYLDRERPHLLLALERTTAREMEQLTKNIEPVAWVDASWVAPSRRFRRRCSPRTLTSADDLHCWSRR